MIKKLKREKRKLEKKIKYEQPELIEIAPPSSAIGGCGAGSSDVVCADGSGL